MTMHECPRCEAAAFHSNHGALSRTTRDEGAPIEVCPRCGEREALYGRDPADQIPFEEWPVPLEQLVEEERVLLTFRRDGKFTMLRADQIVGDD